METPKIFSWRSNPAPTRQFAQTLPPSPLTQHLSHIHALLTIALEQGGLDRELQGNIRLAAEHSLTEIARYSSANVRSPFPPPRGKW